MLTTKTCSLLLALAFAAAACGSDDERATAPTGAPTTAATTSSATTTVAAAASTSEAATTEPAAATTSEAATTVAAPATTSETTTTVGAATTSDAPAAVSTYSSTAFVLPFHVTVPSWLPAEADSDEPNFVTWSAPDIDRAVRFLLPTELYAPGATTATAPPDDYLAYLMAQTADGAEFTDVTTTTVDGRPATVLTANAAVGLDGSLGCREIGMAPADCSGLQPDLTLRIAVIDAGDETLLVWVRDLRDALAEYESFEAMLASIRFDEERVPSATPSDRETFPGGTYATTAFHPTITYTVPDGWVNEEDLPGNFLLRLDGDSRYVGIYRNVATPLECEEKRDPSVDQSIEAITEWLTAHPGLVTTEPERVSIGGLDGVFVDISLEPSWTVTCPYSQGAPIVPFIIGGGPSHLHHVILPGFQERLYLLEMDDGNVAIEIGPEGASLPEYLAAVIPILDGLTFTL